MRALNYQILCCFHIMDLSISDDEKYVVEGFMLFNSNCLSDLIQYVREVSGPAQGNVWKVLSVDM